MYAERRSPGLFPKGRPRSGARFTSEGDARWDQSERPPPPAPRGHRHGGAHPAAGRPPRLLATLFTPPGDSGWSFLFCSDARPCESTNMPPSAPRSIIHPHFHRARPPAVRRACVSRRERPLAFPCRIASRTARPPQGPHVAVQM